jgi:hypothetical protein
MSALQINDSGTWRTANGVYVNDSGTWRTIQTVYVNDSGTWRTVYSSQILSATLVAGEFFDFLDSIGYDASIPMGSLSNTTLPFGTINKFADTDNNPGDAIIFNTFAVTAASDPGIGAINSIVVTGTPTTTLIASGASYGYTGGVAQWTFSPPSNVFVNGNSYTIVVS